MAGVLEARALTKSFGGRPANDRVNLQLRSGEIHALLGENGAGKTTLISMLCGQYQPDEGEVRVHGRPLPPGSPRAALRAGIGVVHQDFRLVPRFTVAENVVLGTPERPGAAAGRVREVAGRAGFALDAQTLASDLSVGQLQQLAILRLLYRQLSTLILDEPTAVLGGPQVTELFQALRRLAGEGGAVLLITHRLGEVLEVADRVTVMRRGRVVGGGPVERFDRDELARLMVGEAEGEGEPLGPARGGEALLRLEHVAGSGLGGVSLEVRRGEIVGVAGVSGNGQPALADVAAGVAAPERGRRWCAGGSVGYVPEDRLSDGLVPELTIAENLALRRYTRAPTGRRLWLSRRRIGADARALIEEFGIPAPHAGAPVRTLSGGGLQRVLLARELAERPDLLVAGQPTRGLDVTSARAVRDRLRQARERGAGVLLVSEDLDEVLELSDRVLVMFRGQITGHFDRGAADRAEIGLRMAGAAG